MKTRTLASMAALLLAGSAAADESVQDRQVRLDERQAELTLQLARIDEVGKLHGRYVLIRDTLLLGDRGVAKQSEQWFDRVGEWVAQWDVLLRVVDGSAPTALTLATTQEEIRRVLAKQAADWRALDQGAQAIEARIKEAEREAGQLRTLPAGYVPGYEAHVQALDSQIEALQKALQQVGAGFVSRRHEEWDVLMSKTEQSVMNRLRRMMLRYPELERSVGKVEDFFRAEREIEPLVDDVERAFTTLETEVLDQRYFHAVKALDALRAAAAASRAKLAESTLDAELTEPAKGRINAALVAGEGLFQSATRSFTPGALVGSHVARIAPSLAAACRHGEERKALNCELLHTLVTIPVDSYPDLDAGMLEYLEYQFDKVKAGPLHRGDIP